MPADHLCRMCAYLLEVVEACVHHVEIAHEVEHLGPVTGAQLAATARDE
jgi:hypothetical protein